MIIATNTSALYTPSELAAILKVGRRTIYSWIRDKKLLAVRVGSRVRIREQAIEEFLRAKPK